MNTHKMAVAALRRMRGDLGSWKKVADSLGLNRGLIHKVVAYGKGSPTVYRALGHRLSSEPEFMKWIREVTVPFLESRQ